MFEIFSIKNGITSVDGFYASGVNAGLKKQGLDVGFIYSDKLCDVEAIFTKNRFQAAPIKHFKKHNIQKTNFILANSKNANAMTGKMGIEDIEEILEFAKEKFPQIKNPIMSSTGVIGVFIPKEKIKNAIENFDLSKKESNNFAKSIMTTDTYEKEIAFEVVLKENKSFKIAGVAKGAGMINPAMATMLCFIVTDADIPKDDMRELLLKNVDKTFNAISVDGDRSTNDSVFLLSNKKSKVYNKEAFDFALNKIMHHLALEIVKDGEGAKKLVGFEISGAKNDDEAKIAAKALSNSLLVKTAIFGEDPNWGRIASTIGASGIECNENSLKISFEDVLVYNKGEILFTKEVEEKAHKIMKKDEFTIKCDLGIGTGYFKAYGCDLGYEYVKINAEYRT
ncbi:bifunctional glutamate N-acetyltransferase/amino-acid acetyltransferase ArgJ [Nitrosophilus kaiyonis]|uniref:bifunctional glutamate N-acetyltransferase/amino-acid acetyltransferase ArgJ n=1 Tax=Nitrosophilus kaiyonis TaxID=2930200 RepID=UPI002492ADA3|nr:bifunctional glutamate N-acetyltransferase/amino-acid acetyltransferase ArgJ [Nitrosophilus kaiyonis]